MQDEVNTLDEPTEFDALVKIRKGEPYFALLGRDQFAPKLICEWANMNRGKALDDLDAGNITEEQFKIELKQSTQAEVMAWNMEEYRNRPETVEVAPAPEQTSGKPTYTGHALPEETVERDREFSTKIAAVRAIHNSIAELSEQVDRIREYDEVAATYLDGWVSGAKEIAARLEPRQILK